ncbi:unnamed protein product [Polarella glacialis]|uniref:Protein kinase domain-containing protein n=1 Tax=Polarella glacialis TaxID=89957 RepID=A0A813F8V1_POLGL|nr:unnamed protein product [Polarella glacialis]
MTLGLGDCHRRPSRLGCHRARASELPAAAVERSQHQQKVRLLRHISSGELFALKCVEKYPLRIRNMITQMHREVRIQQALSHPNILRLVEVVDTGTYLFMVLEYCEKGAVLHHVLNAPNGRLPEAEAAHYFAQMVRGVDWMHQNNCVHRDLKLDNMLLTASEEIKICDFGWSAEVEIERMLTTVCGTTAYWSPEIWESSPQDASVDLWSLGCLLYEMLAGRPAFRGRDQQELKCQVLALDFSFPPWLSPEACDLVQRLLRRKPGDRLRCPAVLTHPWLTRHLPTCHNNTATNNNNDDSNNNSNNNNDDSNNNSNNHNNSNNNNDTPVVQPADFPQEPNVIFPVHQAPKLDRFAMPVVDDVDLEAAVGALVHQWQYQRLAPQLNRGHSGNLQLLPRSPADAGINDFASPPSWHASSVQVRPGHLDVQPLRRRASLSTLADVSAFEMWDAASKKTHVGASLRASSASPLRPHRASRLPPQPLHLPSAALAPAQTLAAGRYPTPLRSDISPLFPGNPLGHPVSFGGMPSSLTPLGIAGLSLSFQPFSLGFSLPQTPRSLFASGTANFQPLLGSTFPPPTAGGSFGNPFTSSLLSAPFTPRIISLTSQASMSTFSLPPPPVR